MNLFLHNTNCRIRLFYWLPVMLFHAHLCCAQYENVWIFGQNAGVDFNGTVPTAITSSMDTSGSWGEANASVCDVNGKLLFYTEGSRVFDRQHSLMPNGNDLTPITSVTSYTPTSSTAQGTIIIPIPGQPEQYYIFSLTSWEQYNNRGRLYYSIVDMSLNAGFGDVVTGAKGIPVDSNLTERMTAGVGSNHCNIWLLTVSQTNELKAFEITSAGISNTPVLSNITGLNPLYGVGCIAVSSDMHKIAITTIWSNNNLTLFDFDPASGMAFNEQLLENYGVGYGVCFSPDNTKLYFNGTSQGAFSGIYQFDLSAGSLANIINSKTRIASAENTHLKLAPDNKIYFGESVMATSLSVINAPDQPGLACQFQANAISLVPGTYKLLGLPNVVPVIRSLDTLYTSREYSIECAGQIIMLIPDDTSGWNYVWSDGITDISRPVTQAGTYWLSYNSPPCNYHADTFIIHDITPGIIIHSACKNTANGQAWVTNIGDTVTYFYAWRSDSDTTILSYTDSLINVPSGNYNVHITTPNCDTILFFHIPEEEYQVSFTASDTIVCINNIVQFQNTSGFHFHTYSWSFGDSHNSTLEHPQHRYEQFGSYEVMQIGEGPICTDTAYLTIHVDTPVNNFSFDIDPREVCMGETIHFYPNTDPSTTALSWNFGDGTGLTTGIAPIPHAYDQEGVHYVQLKASFRACPDILFTDTVIIYPFPKVDLGTDAALCLHGNPIILSNHYPHISGYQYVWSTGATEQQIKVVHHGTYTLTVSNEQGCATTEAVRIDKDCFVDIPNAFTPDGDGLNDYFFPRQYLSKSVSSFRFRIFNRWGQVIFETSNTDGRGWDGKFNGANQPVGVYVYLIEVAFENGRREQYKGNVTLLR